jgi:predicted enzyme related to lactoylglutathione lyase
MSRSSYCRLVIARELLRERYAGPLPLRELSAADIHATYEELSKKGVKFVHPPKEQPYGIETILRDDSGNPFSLVQPRK